MIQVDYLIVGQGLCGTFLSWELLRAGRSVIVIDDPGQTGSSRVAAGIINPVTGRRIVKTWMIDTLLPVALEKYAAIGADLQLRTIDRCDLVDFFPSAQMLLAFRERLSQDDSYLQFPADEQQYRAQFSYDFGFGLIAPAYIVHVQPLLDAWRQRLQALNALRETAFGPSRVEFSNGVSYEDIHASCLILCDGAHSARTEWFNRLPFAFNKGEALIIESELPRDHVWKKGLSLVPLANGQFWVGSSYEWNFSDAAPGAAFRESTIRLLNSWLKKPFRVVDHVAAVRPATIERRPFVGVHPHRAALATLNGMGTKGCSLAPFFAAQLAAHLIDGKPVMHEADISRFRKLLS